MGSVLKLGEPGKSREKKKSDRGWTCPTQLPFLPIRLLKRQLGIGVSPVGLMIDEHELFRPFSHGGTGIDAKVFNERLLPTTIRRPDHAAGARPEVQQVRRRKPGESTEGEGERKDFV